MTTNFRAMCAELVDAYVRGNNLAESIFRARTLLDQPVAEGPTNETPWEINDDDFLLFSPANAMASQAQKRSRRGRPTPQPVAVSERLPGPEDCDAEGRCWGWWTDPMSEYWEYVGVSAPIEPYGSYIPRAGHTHWLPANAIPTPEATND